MRPMQQDFVIYTNLMLEYWNEHGFSFELEDMKEQADKFVKRFEHIDETDQATVPYVIMQLAEGLFWQGRYVDALRFYIICWWLCPPCDTVDTFVISGAAAGVSECITELVRRDMPERAYLTQRAKFWMEYFTEVVMKMPSDELDDLGRGLAIVGITTNLATIYKMDGPAGRDNFIGVMRFCDDVLASLYLKHQGDARVELYDEIENWGGSHYQKFLDYKESLGMAVGSPYVISRL